MREVAVELVEVGLLRHIEGYGARRVLWLTEKIATEGVWTTPIAIDSDHYLVMDGQHRLEVALNLQLKKVPAVMFRYEDVDVWSLRPKYQFDWKLVAERALKGEIYPYKTVKHRFPAPLPACHFSLDELM